MCLRSIFTLRSAFEHGAAIGCVAVRGFGQRRRQDDAMLSVKLDFNNTIPSPPNTVVLHRIAANISSISPSFHQDITRYIISYLSSYRIHPAVADPGQSMLTPHCYCPQRQCSA